MMKLSLNLNRIFSPIAVAWGRTPLVWLWRKPRTKFEFIRQIESRNFMPNWRSEALLMASLLLYFPMLVLWPFRAMIIAVMEFRLHASETRRLYGNSYVGQLVDLLSIGFRYWANPETYYLFKIYKNRDISNAKYFLLENSMTSLLRYVNGTKCDRHIQDKFLFNKRMREKGYPVINDIGVVTQGRLTSPKGSELDLPCCDFIAKPNLGLEGRGLTRFDWLTNGRYCSSEDKCYSAVNLAAHLKELSMHEAYLVQPRLENHPDITDLSNGGFCTSRIITAATPAGNVEVIVAVFKMPTGTKVADNFGAGGIASSIDLQTGELGAACYKHRLLLELDKHPDTGVTIVGRKLPYWSQTLDLVRKAHLDVEGDFGFLGWDVGVTESGPVIVEAQVTFGFILCQRPGRFALGSSRFVEIYSQWADNVR